MALTPRNTIIRVCTILAFTILATILIGEYHRHGLDLIVAKGQPPGMPRGIQSEVEFIDLPGVIEDVLSVDVLLIDMRDEAAFSIWHPKNSINIPYHDFEDTFNRFSANLGADTKIYILCEGILCGMSLRAASGIMRAGFTNVYILKETAEGWKRRGFPVDDDSKENHAEGAFQPGRQE